MNTPLENNEAKHDMIEEAYRLAAKRLHHRDGEVEIDDNAKVSINVDAGGVYGSHGAYVQAWIWVDGEDIAGAVALSDLHAQADAADEVNSQ